MGNSNTDKQQTFLSPDLEIGAMVIAGDRTGKVTNIKGNAIEVEHYGEDGEYTRLYNRGEMKLKSGAEISKPASGATPLPSDNDKELPWIDVEATVVPVQQHIGVGHTVVIADEMPGEVVAIDGDRVQVELDGEDTGKTTWVDVKHVCRTEFIGVDPMPTPYTLTAIQGGTTEIIEDDGRDDEEKIPSNKDDTDIPLSSELTVLRNQVAELSVFYETLLEERDKLEGDNRTLIMAKGRLERELNKERDAHKATKDDLNQLRMDTQKEVNRQVQSMMTLKDREIADLKAQLAEATRPKTRYEIKTLIDTCTTGTFDETDVIKHLNGGWEIVTVSFAISETDIETAEPIPQHYRYTMLRRMVAPRDENDTSPNNAVTLEITPPDMMQALVPAGA